MPENQDRAFLEAIVRIADCNPSKVYEMPSDAGCDYVENGEGGLVGSCLIGCALKEIGVPAEELEYHNSSFFRGLKPYPDWAEVERSDSVDVPTAAGGVIGSLNRRELTNLSNGIKRIAREVQEEQDSGVPWAEAARYARLALEHMN